MNKSENLWGAYHIIVLSSTILTVIYFDKPQMENYTKFILENEPIFLQMLGFCDYIVFLRCHRVEAIVWFGFSWHLSKPWRRWRHLPLNLSTTRILTPNHSSGRAINLIQFIFKWAIKLLGNHKKRRPGNADSIKGHQRSSESRQTATTNITHQ